MKKRFFFLVLVFPLITIRLKSQYLHPEKIDSYISYIDKNKLDVGEISIFQNGKETYSRNFGKIDSKSLKRNSVFQVGSITKLFTATLIFKLIEQNKLSLDTRLNNYFPDLSNSERITIQNLLEHSSGLNNYVKKDEKTIWLTEARNEEEIMSEIKKQRVLFLPNDSIFYSNSGYYLLGKIIEKEFNQSYGKILRENILEPINLSKTNSATENPKHVLDSYSFEKEKWTLQKDFYFKNIVGVGDISSTAKDLNILINSLFQNKILQAESVNRMKPIIGKETYGRGLMTFKFNNIDFYGNTGGTYGTNTILIYDEKSKTSIALIINGQRYPRNEFINDIVDIIYHNRLQYPDIENL